MAVRNGKKWQVIYLSYGLFTTIISLKIQIPISEKNSILVYQEENIMVAK